MRVVVPGTVGPLARDVVRALDAQGNDARFLGKVTDADLDCGMAYVDNDVCVAAIAAIGQVIRWFKERGTHGVDAVVAPQVCADCRSVSLPLLMEGALERAGVQGMRVLEFGSEQVAQALREDDAPLPDHTKPVVGVCGNTVVMTTELFNHTVIDHLRSQGCEVVCPPLSVTANERDFLEPCMAWFDAHGVHTVICILAFGCLGGHVYARGKARKLRERYPHIDLTLLDYDPSASDINVVNRTELVIQAAKERQGQGEQQP